MLQRYAFLCVKLNGDLLKEQCGVTIEDHINRRCRVTVESVMPESGAEIDARKLLGDRVKLSVHVMRNRSTLDISDPLVEVEGQIVFAQAMQVADRKDVARLVFTVEQERGT